MEKTKHRRTRPRRSRLTRVQKVLLTVAVLLAVAVAVTAAYKKLFIQPELPQEDAAAQIDWGDGIQPKAGGARKSDAYYTSCPSPGTPWSTSPGT